MYTPKIRRKQKSKTPGRRFTQRCRPAHTPRQPKFATSQSERESKLELLKIARRGFEEFKPNKSSVQHNDGPTVHYSKPQIFSPPEDISPPPFLKLNEVSDDPPPFLTINPVDN